jgi:hypothetical protein
VGLDHLAGLAIPALSGTEIAKEFTNVLNRKFGDERFFNFAGQQTFQITASNADGTLTQNRTIQLDADDMTYEQVVDKINSQLSGSSNVLSNVSFSEAPKPGEFKGYTLTIDGKVLSNKIDLGTTLSTKPMEDLAGKLQTRIQLDLQQRMGYTAEAASKVTVNIQNENEIRVNDANGALISDFSLGSVSAGAQNEVVNQQYFTGVDAIEVGDYTTFNMEIGNETVSVDLRSTDPSDLNVFTQELQDKIQAKLIEQGWSTFEAGQVTVAEDTEVPGSLFVTDIGGHQIASIELVPRTTGNAPFPVAPVALSGESKITLAGIDFAATPIDTESLLAHFTSLTFTATDAAGALTTTIPLTAASFPSLTGVDPVPSFATFDPTDPVHMELFATDVQTLLRATAKGCGRRSLGCQHQCADRH